MMLSEIQLPCRAHHPTRRLLVLGAPRLIPFLERSPAHRPERVWSWTALQAAARDAHPSSVVLVDPCWETEPGQASATLDQLLKATPSVPVVAAVDFHAADPADALLLLESGVGELVDLSVEITPEALTPTLWAVHARPLKRRVEAGLPRWVSGNALTLLRAAAEITVDHGGRAELARIFSVKEKTVAAWCVAEALPPPRRLLGWMRVLLGGMLLEEKGRTVLNAATCAGYSYDSNLRRAMESFVGTHRSGPTRGWSFDALLAGFAEELWSLREERRSSRRRPASSIS